MGASLTRTAIVRRRLVAQRLTTRPKASPGDLVHWLGAVQAQDYLAAKWALGLRTGLTDSALEEAFDRGELLRTHLLRPTWHFVAPEDIRWLLAVSATRVLRWAAPRFHDLGLDSRMLSKAGKVLTRALTDATLTRVELAAAVRRAKLPIDHPRGTMMFLMFWAELEGIVCSGPRRGNQFTYALLDQRVPATRPKPREEALGELARRYFRSRGPATVKDFVWWSGLSPADARAALGAVQHELDHETTSDTTFWFATDGSGSRARVPRVHLLPCFDEYVVGYADTRSAIVDVPITVPRNPLFDYTVMVGGRLVGTWKRIVGRGTVTIRSSLIAPLASGDREACEEAAHAYGRFLGLPVTIETSRRR